MNIEIQMILVAFTLKLIDNTLGTVKSIYLHKERYLLGALFNSAATFFYLVAIVQIAKSNDMLSIIAMCFATFLGTLIPGLLMKKSERDKLFIYDITAIDLESGKNFADLVRDNNIPIKTFISYDKDLNKVLSCKAFCPTKNESRIVDGLIPSEFKYNKYTPLEYNN